MQPSVLLDRAGRRRSPAALPGYHQGRPPRNKGLRYPPDPPTVEEIIAVMRAGGENVDGLRLRGLIVVLWRAGLRISEALALAESDLDPERGATWSGAGRAASAARSGWTAGPGSNSRPGSQSAPRSRSVPRFVCCGHRPADAPAPRPPSASQLRNAASRAGIRRRFAPHQLRHAHAVEISREGMFLGHHPTPARTRPPRHNLGLPPRHRQHRNHPHRPPATRAHDPRHQRTGSIALTRRGSRTRSTAHRSAPEVAKHERELRRLAW
jgi:integrase